jgi:hypothetical protein
MAETELIRLTLEMTVSSETLDFLENAAKAGDAVILRLADRPRVISVEPVSNLEDVIRLCNCWSERFLRDHRTGAVNAKNHDATCPAHEKLTSINKNGE